MVIRSGPRLHPFVISRRLFTCVCRRLPFDAGRSATAAWTLVVFDRRPHPRVDVDGSEDNADHARRSARVFVWQLLLPGQPRVHVRGPYVDPHQRSFVAAHGHHPERAERLQPPQRVVRRPPPPPGGRPAPRPASAPSSRHLRPPAFKELCVIKPPMPPSQSPPEFIRRARRGHPLRRASSRVARVGASSVTRVGASSSHPLSLLSSTIIHNRASARDAGESLTSRSAARSRPRSRRSRASSTCTCTTTAG